jgi:hypothetical protein
MLCAIESKQNNPVFKIERQQQQNKDVFCQHFVIKTNPTFTRLEATPQGFRQTSDFSA